MSKWQPIETAPRDGTTILTWSKLALPLGDFMVMKWTSENGWEEFWGNSGLHPTHWMPLPEPPEGV